ncbi:MAG: FHA domain-containing protein [Lachnospiraceae bacterium]|nr:FHA domain-containing protein [Lachnospiraceae bacterium]
MYINKKDSIRNKVPFNKLKTLTFAGKCLAFFACAFLIFMFVNIEVHAEETAGVVRIRATYVYESEKDSYNGAELQKEFYGSGVLVTSEGESGQYIITSYDIAAEIDNSKEYKFEIVLNNGITVGASIQSRSEELGVSVLKVDGKYVSEGLVLYDGEPSLSYPDLITIIGYSNDNLQKHYSGQVMQTSNNQGNYYIYFNWPIDEEMYGAPILNEEGYVEGICINREPIGEGSKGTAVSMTSVSKVFKELGISYKSYSKEKEEAAAKAKKTKIILIIVGSVVGTIGLAVFLILFLTRKKRAAKREQKRLDFTVTEPAPDFSESKMLRPDYKMLLAVSGGAETKDEDEGGTTILQSKPVENTLYVLERVKTQERTNVSSPQLVVGKDASQTDYHIEGNGAISRVHALLVFENGRLYISDKNTTNGTFINDKRLKPYESTPVNPGDKICFANEEFRIYIG